MGVSRRSGGAEPPRQPAAAFGMMVAAGTCSRINLGGCCLPTPLGCGLGEAIDLLCTWAYAHIYDINAAREAYESAKC
jgi:hypothetical protein